MTFTMRKLFILLFILQLPACATIHFENGDVIPDPEPKSYPFGVFDNLFGDDDSTLDAGDSIRFRKWYNHGFYQIAEISNPLDISRVCPGLEWNQITTEVTPLDVFVSLLDNALLFNASSAGVDLWSHWSMEYSCRNH